MILSRSAHRECTGRLRESLPLSAQVYTKLRWAVPLSPCSEISRSVVPTPILLPLPSQLDSPPPICSFLPLCTTSAYTQENTHPVSVLPRFDLQVCDIVPRRWNHPERLGLRSPHACNSPRGPHSSVVSPSVFRAPSRTTSFALGVILFIVHTSPMSCLDGKRGNAISTCLG